MLLQRRPWMIVSVATAFMSAVLLAAQDVRKSTGRSNDAGGKTAWGEPDLQGIWGLETDIPLQRSDEYAGKETLTDEERAQIDKQRAAASYFDNRGRGGVGAGQGQASQPYDDLFLSRKKSGKRTSLIVEPRDGKIPPPTSEAVKRRDALRAFQLALLQPTDACKNGEASCAGGKYGPASPLRFQMPPYYSTGNLSRAFNPEDRSLRERCFQGRLPDLGLIPYGYFLQLVQSPQTVSIFYDTGQGEMWQRVIPVDGTPHLPSHIRQWNGDSRGHWEGKTLVVDVTNFTAKADFQGSRENLHLIERWARTDANTLEYTVTMEDPTTWTRPWTAVQEYKKQSDRDNKIYHEPRCHEGNYAMASLLRGAREEEKAFAEGKGPDPATIAR